MIIYHKAGCSTCAEALSLLDAAGCEYKIREYLKEPPSKTELRELLDLLGCEAIDLVRKKEPLYQEQFSDREYSTPEWIEILSRHPILIERPIVINGNNATIGRPPQKVLSIVNKSTS